ncbi:MAG: glycosyltransferase family 4 protein [Bacteroidales bacterium]|nr:glycosyltransferase family 4 protein [Bacteroidales bacterium]
MKILHILNSPNIGGIEWFVYYLAKAQTERKSLDIGVFFCKTEGDLKSLFQDIDVKCYFTDLDASEFNVNKYLKMHSIAKEYDIVHLHSFRPVRDLFLYFGKNKIIYTNHTVFGYGRNVKKTDTLRWSLFKYFSNKKEVSLTFNSKYTRDFWHSRGIQNSRSKVIYNGVGFKVVTNKNLKNELNLDGKFIIGTSCRLIEWKRIDILIKAFYIFQENKKDAFLVIVGDGAEKNKLQEMVKSYGIDQKVLFMGNVVNVEEYQYMMDVCVFPSTTEAFGLVAIECMQYGKPVLVMDDGGGIREVVEKIEPTNICNNVNSLVGNLNKYFSDQDLLEGEYKEKRIAFSKEFDMSDKEGEFYDSYQLM